MKTTVLVSLLFVFLALYTIVLAKTPKFVPLVDTNAGVSTGSNLVSNLPISPRFTIQMECSNSNCFETETCCNTTTGKAACCPELDACCCPDHTHCCPTYV